MQTECPHRRFYRLDAIRDELSPQAAERFDKLALFDQLRREGASQLTDLKAVGYSRATLYRWKRRLREHGFAPSASATGRMIARLVRIGQAEPIAFYYGRVKPRRRKFDRYAKRRRCGDRGRRPGQMVQIDHMGIAIETACQRRGIALFVPLPESPDCSGCVERANAAGCCEFHQFYAGELSVGALNACRPHQALGQRPPMQAYNENFNQSALAA